jgi:hypothetical protein
MSPESNSNKESTLGTHASSVLAFRRYKSRFQRAWPPEETKSRFQRAGLLDPAHLVLSGCLHAGSVRTQGLPDCAALFRADHLIRVTAAEGLEELRHVGQGPIQPEAR